MKDFLKQHQKAAVEKMKDGCILNGKTGSGKSRTALYYYFKEYGGRIDDDIFEPMIDNPPDLYIITTAKKRDSLDWEGEMVPFQLGTNRETDVYDHNVFVDSWNNIKKYKEITGAFFIFDEDRVTGRGPWVDAFIKIAKHNRWILLSATPGDTWMDYIPVFVANGWYKNRTAFVREHVIYNRFTKYPSVSGYVDQGRLIKLRRKLLVDMDFEGHTTQHHETIVTSYDKVQYKMIFKNRWNPFKDKPVENASEFCQCLRRVVNTDWSRIESVLDILEKKNRIIVFYNYNYEVDLLRAYDYGDDVTVAEWNGSKHEKLPTSDRWVYLVQYLAGCEGWNCTSTDTIIFFSENYSYRTMVQAAGRIDRMNTPFDELYYYHLKSMSSIDLAIERALRNKKKFNEERFYGG